MRNVQRLMGIAGIVLACAPACSTKQSGQIMLAVQTDMSLPKDVDRVRIEVTRADSGSVIFKRDFERLGTDKAIRLPATLGITAPEEASTAIVIRVIATQGSDESGSRRTPGGYFFSSTTICIRRFFARPATVLLSAMGFDGP